MRPENTARGGTDAEEQDDELDEALTGMDYIPYTQRTRRSSSHKSSSGTTRMSTLAASKH